MPPTSVIGPREAPLPTSPRSVGLLGEVLRDTFKMQVLFVWRAFQLKPATFPRCPIFPISYQPIICSRFKGMDPKRSKSTVGGNWPLVGRAVLMAALPRVLQLQGVSLVPHRVPGITCVYTKILHIVMMLRSLQNNMCKILTCPNEEYACRRRRRREIQRHQI